MTRAGNGSPGPERFEANNVSLDDGVVLLEASAGTGKTFALAHLVLRLLAERRLGLRELLVVTYTNAAAAELRDRIGRRLQEALTGLQPPDGWAAPDPVLVEWLEHQPEEPGARGTVQGLLLLALEELDAADITTIHGFCQRTLRRHAMEAARPPELTLEIDAADLVRQVAHDYWQQQVLALPLHLAEGLAAAIDLGDLERLLLLLDGDPGLALDPLPPGLGLERPLAEQLTALWEEPWARFRQAWSDGGRELEQAFRAAAAQWRAAGASATTPYAVKPRNDRSELVDAWLAQQPEGGSYAALMAQKELGSYFHPDPFCRMARKVEGTEREIQLPDPGLLEAVAALREGPAEAVLLHGSHWGRAELARRRARSGSIGFAQLLEGLDPGPDATAPTPLLRAVGQRYRAALIDEFQDTDPVQWRILRLAFTGDAHLLVMVGDPKQAIYRFRGGDLDTYRLARRSAARVLALQENRRSTPALIGSLNALMAPAGLPRSDLPVPAVLARSRRSGPDGMAPVRLLWLGGERGAGDALPSRSVLEARLPALVADAVLELLEQAPALAVDNGRPPSPLRASDIALLVHNHRQAEDLRSALERRHIASRLVSKADVFASPAATALQRLLDALADPADPGRLRLLAASPLLGWSARRIAEAAPAEWSELAGGLQALARDLPHQGPLGVLSRLVDGEGLARMSVSGRLLADLQQVAELLQERLHVEQLALVAAADWLRRLRLDQTRASGTIPESHQAHSDKADEAATVITVHRSKGLEFPVVICPYLWQAAGTPPPVATGWASAGIRPPAPAPTSTSTCVPPGDGDGRRCASTGTRNGLSGSGWPTWPSPGPSTCCCSPGGRRRASRPTPCSPGSSLRSPCPTPRTMAPSAGEATGTGSCGCRSRSGVGPWGSNCTRPPWSRAPRGPWRRHRRWRRPCAADRCPGARWTRAGGAAATPAGPAPPTAPSSRRRPSTKAATPAIPAPMARPQRGATRPCGRSRVPWPASPAARGPGTACTGCWSSWTTGFPPTRPPTGSWWNGSCAGPGWRRKPWSPCCGAWSRCASPPLVAGWGPCGWPIWGRSAGSTNSASTSPSASSGRRSWRPPSRTIPAVPSVPPTPPPWGACRWPAAASSPARST
ncbi:UvrD-helicase domain-containing protein [Cyanobium gracile]|uniref:UvrD-helicase domain-containing protein n=1 Tax=Cyanobium gracile TaxID=59930 RepID=UPI0002D96FF0|nr:UvrD-helicase domain-containing protein [Cyanobium gracile]